MLNRFLAILFIASAVISCGALYGENTGANDLEQPPVAADNKQDRNLDSQKEDVPSQLGGLSAKKVGDKFFLSGVASNGGNSSHAFKLKFEVDQSETNFHLFADSSIENGLVMSFYMNTQNAIMMKMTLNGISHEYEITEAVESKSLDIVAEVHNDHSDAHILVWINGSSYADNEECTFEGTCVYNSEDFAFDIWAGVGRAAGTYWGVSGNTEKIESLEGPLDAFSKH